MGLGRLFGFWAAICLLGSAIPAVAHRERPIVSPVRPGPVPAIDRVNQKQLVVCKASSKPTKAYFDDIQARLSTATGAALVQAQAEDVAWRRNTKLFHRCCFEHIQDAVNAADDDTDILIMPGVYREEPSRAMPTSSSGDLPDGSYSYAYHLANPNDANLIAILGKRNITLEGTGWRPEEVLVDAGFTKDVGIRCDKCNGFIIRNMSQKDANEHGVYTVDSDGYVYDRVIGSYSLAYELFGFASDNGLMVDCEAVGGGDSGFYIGGAPVTAGRYSQVIRRAKMHHNALGFSGTQGNSVLITESDIYDNAVGISFDSENDHPNFPQAFSVVEFNDIHDNNFDIYAATSDVPVRGPGYDFFRYPVGTGMWNIGGEDNIIRNNRVYNNQRFGFLLAANPLEAPLLAEVHRNQYVNNLMGVAAGGGAGPNATAFPPGGDYLPGGSDFLWDETGNDNCWGPNGSATTDPNPIPGPCPAPNTGAVLIAPAPKLSLLLSCSLKLVPGSDPPEFVTTDLLYPCPWGHENFAGYQNASQAECGNGVIDVGEDCDPGTYALGWPNLGGESCQSLGHGDGTLACDQLCQWDLSACEVTDTCRNYRAFRASVGDLSQPPGGQRFRIRARKADGAPFDPLTEAVDVVVRDSQQQQLFARIPAGDPRWRSASPTRYEFRDVAGTYGGIKVLTLKADSTFANGFSAFVKFVHGVNLSGMATTTTTNTVIRIGDDCWAREAPCSGAGDTLRCAFTEKPCKG